MNPTVNVDLIFNGKAQGSVASKLMTNGMSPLALRPWIGDDGRSYMTINQGGELVAVPTINAALLRKDEWKQYDDAILRVQRDRLVGVNDLIARGLTYNIGNGLGKTVLEYEDMNDPGSANVSMDGLTRGQNDRPEYIIRYLPLPIIHADFTINARFLAASRNGNLPADTTMVEAATRRVLEKLEDMLFTDTTYAYGGGTIYSYLNHPHVNTVTLGTHWDASAKTGANIKDDVLNMMQASITAGFRGPWMLYIPTEYQTAMGEDYNTNYPKTVRQRLLEMEGLLDIKVADRMPTDKVVLVQMTSDVVRLVQGLGVTPVEWDSQGGMVHDYKVMTIQVPQIRSDQNNKCGVTLLSAA